jgi:hypothetical protein
MKQYSNMAKRALVIQSCSFAVRAGDVLERESGSEQYVLIGEEAAMKEKEVRHGFMWMKRTRLFAPNYFSAAHVENLPEYFHVALKTYPKSPAPAPAPAPAPETRLLLRFIAWIAGKRIKSEQ